MTLPDEAHPFLREWLGETWRAEPLAGDASVRRYYRLSTPGGETYMLTYYPPELREGVPRFLAAWQVLEGRAAVPEVLRHCDSSIAQRDVGDETLFDVLHRDAAAAGELYTRAVDLLVEFQSAGADGAALNPPFDRQKFSEELEMTREFYFGQLLSRTPAENSALPNEFGRLAEELTQHPYVLCHRDYHAQNIHLFKDGMYIIDYQDMRMGPDTYDLASLLRDRGAAQRLGEDREERLIRHYARLIGADLDPLRRRYFATLLQRSIKAIGTFARQAVTRSRNHYLAYIPPTLESIHRCAAELPEWSELASAFPPGSPR